MDDTGVRVGNLVRRDEARSVLSLSSKKDSTLCGVKAELRDDLP